MKKGLLIFFLSAINIAYAQKKPLDHNVYDSWQSISSRQLTANGQFAMYNIAPQQGDTVLHVSNLKTQANNTIPRAFKANFSNDSKFAAFIIRPAYNELRKARIQKKKATEIPKDTLGILNLISNQTLKIADIKSYKLPEKGFGHIAYLSSKVDTTNKSASTSKKPEGSELVLRNLNTTAEKTFKNVTDYFFSKNGNLLAFVSVGSKNDPKDAGVYLLDTEKGTIKTLIKGKGTFKNFAFDEEDEHLAFVGEQSPEKQEIKNFNVYYSSLSLDTAQVIVDYDMSGLPKNWSINGDSKVNFSKDGSKLFFGIAPIKKPKDTTIIDFEVAKVDIWHYKDDYLQTQQLKNADRESKRGFLAVVDVFSGIPKVLPLATPEIPDVLQLNEGDSPFVLASTDYGRRIESQWTGKTSKDYYLVNTKTGVRKKIIDNLNGRIYPSPEANFIVYFDNNKSAWFSYQIATDKTYSLAVGDIKFYNEENDLPDTPNSYGLAAFTQDDKSVLIYDKYDIWQFALDGKSTPKNITNNFGRQNKISFRYIKTDAESKSVKNNEVIYLNAFNEISKENGLYRKPLNASKNPELLTQGKYTFSNFTKAKNAEVFTFEKASYVESPNLYTTVDFKTDVKLSNTNPQQKDFNWGSSELVKWTTPQGFNSEGILYKPEDFDPNKKYPMIVYFYEKLSDGLYNYIAPQPTPSRLNISYFVSNGYLVFAPDISYLDGNPGPSAVEFINSGVESLKKNAWVDGTKIGIQGQSWGGYQVAYLITQNDMYAAAWSGAPVVNMTSAYGGIRWDSGLNRQFQYEKTQSRIGGTLWEKQDLYIKNSPLFMFPKVNTPVVIMANDADGAVPWYQGIEMFTALRRLGKPVWMLNYNNEAHNLVQRQNRKDIQIREQQFFDHYLKGAKAPVWMTSGVPATEKGKTWGFELTDNKP